MKRTKEGSVLTPPPALPFPPRQPPSSAVLDELTEWVKARVALLPGVNVEDSHDGLREKSSMWTAAADAATKNWISATGDVTLVAYESNGELIVDSYHPIRSSSCPLVCVAHCRTPFLARMSNLSQTLG